MERCIDCEVILDRNKYARNVKRCRVCADYKRKQVAKAWIETQRQSQSKRCVVCKEVKPRDNYGNSKTGTLLRTCNSCVEKREGKPRESTPRFYRWEAWWKQFKKPAPKVGIVYLKGKPMKR